MKNIILWLIAIFGMLAGILVMPGSPLQAILGLTMFGSGYYMAYRLTYDKKDS